MTAKTTIGIVAALLLGFADAAYSQSSEFDRVFQSVTPKQETRQANQKAQVLKRSASQKRAPARVTVRPALRYRHDATEFPRTDNLGYPGPNAVRQCVSWLATEHRLSGTVVTPQMRCWWQRG